MNKVLTIAGSDCSGGAGIQADIKTMTVHNVFAMSAITALTAQNTLGVTDIVNVSNEFMASQLDAIFTDIYPDAIKIGMVSEPGIIDVIVEKLKQYKCKNVVIDPVMVATSGAMLISEEAKSKLLNELIPLATIITPNIMEAEELTGFAISSEKEMINAAKKLSTLTNGAVLIKGGHFGQEANDLLYFENEVTWFSSKRVDNPNTHGTGCTLSSAIASNLANGKDIKTSVKNSKEYISKAINANLDLGQGRGPLNHMS